MCRSCCCAWRPLVWCQVIASLHVLLIPLHALLPAATLVMSWRNCVTLEQRWSGLSSTKTGVSALFLIGFSIVRTHTLHRRCLFLSHCSRAASRRALLYFTCAMVGSTSCASTASSSDCIFAHYIWNPVMELLFHVQIGGIFVLFVDENRFWRASHSLVILLLICCVTRRDPMIPLNDVSGTIARGKNPKVVWHCVTSTC